MKLSLVVLTPGKTEGKLMNIPLAQFVIGRDPQCHLRPASPSISKRHCAVIQRDGKVFVRDFDSTNGTFVNDQPIKGEVELQNGDQLKVGPLLFGVKIESTSPAVNRPTPAPPTKAPAKAAAPPAPKPASAPAPAPATDKKPATKPVEDEGSGDEDSVAAMLLSLQDDGEGGGLGGEVPEGSTVMDLAVPPPEGEAEEKKDEKKEPTVKPSSSNAAKALLEKYMRRPR